MKYRLLASYRGMLVTPCQFQGTENDQLDLCRDVVMSLKQHGIETEEYAKVQDCDIRITVIAADDTITCPDDDYLIHRIRGILVNCGLVPHTLISQE